MNTRSDETEPGPGTDPVADIRSTPRARRHRTILILLTAFLVILPLILMTLRIMGRV